MEGYFTFQWGPGCFPDGGASFLSGGWVAPWGGIGFNGGVFEKNYWMRAAPHAPHPLWETLKPFIKKGLLEEME